MGLSAEQKGKMAAQLLGQGGGGKGTDAPVIEVEVEEPVEAVEPVVEEPAVEEEAPAEEPEAEAEEPAAEEAAEEPAAEVEDAPVVAPVKPAPGVAAGGFKGKINHNGTLVDLDLSPAQHVAALQIAYNARSIIQQADEKVATRAGEAIDQHFLGNGLLKVDPTDPEKKRLVAGDDPTAAIKYMERLYGASALKEAAMRYAGVEVKDELKSALADIEAERKDLDPEIDGQRIRDLNRQEASIKSQVADRDERRRVSDLRQRAESENQTRETQRIRQETFAAHEKMLDTTIAASPFAAKFKSFPEETRGRIRESIRIAAAGIWQRGGSKQDDAAKNQAYQQATREIAADYGVVQKAEVAGKGAAQAAAAKKPSKAPPSTKGASAPAAVPGKNGNAHPGGNRTGFRERMTASLRKLTGSGE